MFGSREKRIEKLERPIEPRKWWRQRSSTTAHIQFAEPPTPNPTEHDQENQAPGEQTTSHARRPSFQINRPMTFVPEATIKQVHDKVEKRNIERRQSFFRERQSARGSSEAETTVDAEADEEEEAIMESPPVHEPRRESRRLSLSQAKSLQVIMQQKQKCDKPSKKDGPVEDV